MDYFKDALGVDDCVASNDTVMDELVEVWKEASCILMNDLAKTAKLIVSN